MQRPRGLHIDVHVSGTYQRIAKATAPRPMTMNLTLVLSPSASLREPVMAVRGTLEAAGLAHDVPITGTARISDWRQPSLAYTSTFTSDQGEPLQLHGSRRLNLRTWLRARLALHAEIRESQGNLLARCQLVARLRWTQLLRS